MEKNVIEKRTILDELVKSRHGDFMSYVKTGLLASKHEADFFSHLITWNLLKGEIRDTKVVLPVLALRNLAKFDDEDLAENAIANLMSLDPRNLVKAYRFNKELSKKGHIISGGYRRMFENAIKKYLALREENVGVWNRAALQHKASMKELYAVSHTKPSPWVQQVLFDKTPPKGSVFEKVAQLKNMKPLEAAGTILQNRIPFQIALGAIGKTKKELIDNPAFLLALMEGMSGQQLINSTKFLTSVGVMDSPMLKSEYQKALQRAKKDKKVSTLKASKAVEVLEDAGVHKDVIAKMVNIQEAKMDNCSIEGDWLILGDKSYSMSESIEISRRIAALISRAVKGKVYLIFFDNTPRFFDVTGKTLDEITKITKRIESGGGTSCGCGIQYLRERNIEIDGIALISDGGDWCRPMFSEAYVKYAKTFEKEPPVYYFTVAGDGDEIEVGCKKNNIDLEVFNLRKGDIDYYSLPNLVSQMKTVRYSLIDEIMNTELLTLDKVFSTFK